MSTKVLFLFCVQAVSIQIIAGQCLGNAFNGGILTPGLGAAEGFGWAGAPWGYGGPGGPLAGAPLIAPEWTPLGPATISSSNGGGFIITSSSPIPPIGVSVVSDNEYTGPLAVGGQLPFLGTVELEGALPTTGSGAISYGCGNGNVGMVSEDIMPNTELAYTNGLAPGFGYGPGLGGPFNYGMGPAGFGFNGLNRCEAV